MGISWCCVQGCRSNSKAHANLSFFRLPKDKERLGLWIEKTKRYDLERKDPMYAYRSCRICSKHFDRSMLKVDRGGKVSLIANAVPTLFIASSSSICSLSSNGSSFMPLNRNDVNSKISSAQISISFNSDKENIPPNSPNIQPNSLLSPRNAAATPCTSRTQTFGVRKRAKKQLLLDSSSMEGQLDPDSDSESFFPPFSSTIHRGFVSGIYNFNRTRKLSFNIIDSVQPLEDSPQDSYVRRNIDHSYSKGEAPPASNTLKDSSMQTKTTDKIATTNFLFLDHSYSKLEVPPASATAKGLAMQSSQTNAEDSSSFFFPPATNKITICAMQTSQTTTQDSSSFHLPPATNKITICATQTSQTSQTTSQDSSSFRSPPATNKITICATQTSQTSQTTSQDSSSFRSPPATNKIMDCATQTSQTTTQDSSYFRFPPRVENCSTDSIPNGNESADIISTDTSMPYFDSISSVTEVTLGSKASTDCATQAEPFLSSDTPRKAKLRRTTKRLQAKVKRLNAKDKGPSEQSKLRKRRLLAFDELCKEFLPKPLCNIIQEQARLSQQKPKGRRYSMQVKKFALGVFCSSPKAHRLLSTIMSLPAARSLRRLTEHWEFKPGFNKNVFAVLKTKIAAIPKDRRICCLVADEFSMKANLFYDHSRDEIVGLHDTGVIKSFRVATHALVFMARGILDGWKQPIAFFFVNNGVTAYELKELITIAVRKIAEAGLDVKVFTSDLGSNFEKYSKLMGVTSIHPFFHVDGKKIYHIFDVPHLMKCWRNNLMNYKFKFNGKVADWKYLREFYAMDKRMSLRLTPKLTDAHIDPNNFEKMKVKYATQIFSATVSAALNTYVDLKVLPDDALPLAELLEKGDKLFDLLNSWLFRPKKKFNYPFRGKQYQRVYLYNMLRFFSNLKLLDGAGKDVTKQVKFIEGFKQTIRAILDLWSEMKRNGKSYLFTRRLNSDCLENFFALLRSIFGFCRNPTPIQVQRGFKKLFCVNFFVKSMNTNCEEDCNEILAVLDSTDFEALKEKKEKRKMTEAARKKRKEEGEKSAKNLAPVEPDGKAQCVNNGTASQVLTPTKDPIPDRKEVTFGCKTYMNIKPPFENGLAYVAGYLLDKCLELHSCDVCIKYAKDCDRLAKSNIFIHFKAYNTQYNYFGGLNTPPKEFLYFVYHMENTVLNKLPEYAIEKPAARLIKDINEYNFKHPCPQFEYKYLVELFIRFRIFHILKDNNNAFKDRFTHGESKVECSEKSANSEQQTNANGSEEREPENSAQGNQKRKQRGTERGALLIDARPVPKRVRRRNQKLLNLKHL